MNRDLHNSVTVVPTISPVAVGTTGTGQTGVAVDTQGYEGAEVVVGYGAITATAATFTVTIEESAVTTASGFAAVADEDLLGTESAAGLAAATRVDGSTEKVYKTIGYIGAKRYIRAKVSSTATAGTPVSAAVVLHHPRTTSGDVV